MEDSVKISVILPVYNCEKYLARSIESVIRQTYDNWELIIVNDGSKDSSKKIAQEFVERDERIRLVNQKNQGVSCARNLGIDEAIGDILMFLDADDWFEEDAFEEVVTNWDDSAQMLLFDYYDVPENRKKQYRKLFKEDKIEFGKDGERSISDLELIIAGVWSQQKGARILLSVPWGRVFQANYIKKSFVRFPEGIVIFEDVIFNIRAILDMRKVIYLSKSIYAYYINADSASNISYKKNGERLISNFIKVNNYAKEILEKEKSELNETAYYRLVFDGIKAIIYWIADEADKEKRTLGRNYCYSQVQGIGKYMGKKYCFADRVLLFLCEKKCFIIIEKIVSIRKKAKKVLNMR